MGLLSILLVAACATSSDGTSKTAAADAGGGHTAHGAAANSPAPAAPLRAGERFVTVSMPQAYTPQAPNGGTDEYRCFLVDPGITGPSFLTGSQFFPQNTAIVHHAIFFRVSPENAGKARAVDDSAPGEGWTCFGDAGIGVEAPWIAQWAPGSDEKLLSEDVGYPLPPGTLLVMQVHYNLLATDGHPAGSDQSSIRLRIADGANARSALQTMQLYAPIELPCPADDSGPLCDRNAAVADVTQRFSAQVGATENRLNQLCNQGTITAGPTQHCDYPIKQAGTVYALLGHMHLLGRSITVVLNPGTATERTLLDVPNFDFDNQAIRPLSTPIAVQPGDTMRVTCSHDAGLRRQLPALRNVPARYVVWGDGTSDEMCLGLAIWAPRA